MSRHFITLVIYPPECTVADIERLMGVDQESVRRQAALFLLKMKEKKFLTQSAVDEMVERTSSIFTHTFSMLKAGIREKLTTHGIDPCDLDMDSVFDQLSDPFDGLKTKHFQDKYFKESLRLIVSYGLIAYGNACNFIQFEHSLHSYMYTIT